MKRFHSFLFYFSAESAKPLQPMGYAAAPPPPTTMTYGVQPLEDGNLPQPPSYGDAMNQPYPTPAPYSGTYIVNLLKYSHTPPRSITVWDDGV